MFCMQFPDDDNDDDGDNPPENVRDAPLTSSWTDRDTSRWGSRVGEIGRPTSLPRRGMIIIIRLATPTFRGGARGKMTVKPTSATSTDRPARLSRLSTRGEYMYRDQVEEFCASSGKIETWTAQQTRGLHLPNRMIFSSV